MELLSGFPLLIQQYKALLKKNAILTWRSKRSAIVQLFSSLFFMLLLFGVDRAIRAQAATHTEFKNVRDPPTREAPPIPPCEDKFFAKPPCYDFVWSGAGARIQGIVKGIMKNNPGREISDDRVKSFRTPEEVDTWLLDNPLRCPGALHFVEKNSTVISYGVQTNSTSVAKRGQNEDPTFKFQIPLQIAAEREIARSLLGDPNFIWTVGFKEFAHPATETSSSMETLGPTFFLAVAMFSFVFQISALVAEKELKLRQAMSMMGLYESAYWLSWLTWETLLTLISALFTVLFGMMFQFDFFLKNNFAIVFLVFFLFQLAMLGFAFMISTLMSKSSSATTVGFAIFIVGFLAQFAGMLIYSDIIEKKYQILWSLFPPNPLAAALRMLAAATATPDDHGISWSKRGECGPKSPNCVMTIEDVLLWLIATFVLWFVVALYLDNIIPNANGVRKPVYYFLQPSYWTGKGGEKVKEGSLFSWRSSAPSLQEVTPDDEDVLAEETTVKRQASENETDPNVAVQICGLAKTYPSTISCRCRCCKCCCSKSPPYHAVKGIWVNLAKNQLFCLLGPNGAGKTTAISCLTGITPVTGGDALIYGHSVRNPIGMSNIRKIIGVCPQFDILWDALSSSEHLHLFSSLKGLPPSTINSAVEKSLAEVKLTRAAKVRAGSYSGGMKRRLSVAIALLGDPKLVFLDEPTTGMDPISRRHVWDIIGEAKKGRAIVLTTHSMEEADILSDRIAIMAKGRLRCLGTSIRLKSRFGTGYIATVNFQGSAHGSDAGSKEPRAEPLKKFFKFHLNLDPKEETKSFLTYIIPREKEGILTDFFGELQLKEKELGITDIQLGLTTLEEVFLNIAKKAEIESSAAEGTLVQITLASGASVQIPVGARFVGIPGTVSSENPSGLMVEVYWDQDDSGRLCVSGHSDETPIPSSVPSAANALTRRASRGRSPVGFVIDPNQITSGRG